MAAAAAASGSAPPHDAGKRSRVIGERDYVDGDWIPSRSAMVIRPSRAVRVYEVGDKVEVVRERDAFGESWFPATILVQALALGTTGNARTFTNGSTEEPIGSSTVGEDLLLAYKAELWKDQSVKLPQELMRDVKVLILFVVSVCVGVLLRVCEDFQEEVWACLAKCLSYEG